MFVGVTPLSNDNERTTGCICSPYPANTAGRQSISSITIRLRAYTVPASGALQSTGSKAASADGCNPNPYQWRRIARTGRVLQQGPSTCNSVAAPRSASHIYTELKGPFSTVARNAVSPSQPHRKP